MEIQSVHVKRNKEKMFLTAHEIMVCVGKPMNLHKNSYDKWVNTEYKVNIQKSQNTESIYKSISYLYTINEQMEVKIKYYIYTEPKMKHLGINLSNYE